MATVSKTLCVTMTADYDWNAPLCRSGIKNPAGSLSPYCRARESVLPETIRVGMLCNVLAQRRVKIVRRC